MSNEIPVVSHNGSDYDYHSIIKKLAKKFGRQFQCLRENTEKDKTFLVPIEKGPKKAVKDCNENIVTISYKIKFLDSAIFMASSVSNLIDNLAERIQTIKCKYCDSFFEYESVNDNLINYKCLFCN